MPTHDGSTTSLSYDALWPRAGSWGPPVDGDQVDLALVGIPTHRLSLSPSNAHKTPAAIREALRRYSAHVATDDRRSLGRVLDDDLRIFDFGDVEDPDSELGESVATARVAEIAERARLAMFLGGDNSLTVPAALGVAGDNLDRAGLITLDAHHDLRDGRSNGSPVRRLIEAGLNPRRVVQIGIADFANSQAYRQRALDLGITVIHRDELFERSLSEIAAEALGVAGAGGGPVHVDVDVDVCDRSVAPGCPASIPGGLQAHELRRLTRAFARSPLVRGIDIAEVDASADSADGRTVRLAALTVLEAAAGLAERTARPTAGEGPS
ncbi:arginase family protein [Microbacterium sp. 179-I 3D3 NHS]|uniref:arginase family protein n=1 Tax=Microbacterium sp. 179-I 3D3 NHS TaxID=3142382 RepID=UPI0039A08261